MIVSKSKAKEHLELIIKHTQYMMNSDFNQKSPEFLKWRRDTQVAIEYIFGSNSAQANEIHLVNRKIVYSRNQNNFKENIKKASFLLNSMLEEIVKFWSDTEQSKQAEQYLAQSNKTYQITNKVFIIHGHNMGLKDTVARYLSEIGLEPIILHEQANEGRTIIEKLEQYSNVSYAIALFTPDDIGGLKTEPNKLKPRARQNVIFEFGFFIGKLGREKVCALLSKQVDMLSDYAGVLYIPFDSSEAWKFKLAKELKKSGLKVDRFKS